MRRPHNYAANYEWIENYGAKLIYFFLISLSSCKISDFYFQITSTLDNLPVTQPDVQSQNCNVPANGSANGSINGNKFSPNGHNEEISIGSAGSLARRQSLWDEDLLSGKINGYCYNVCYKARYTM